MAWVTKDSVEQYDHTPEPPKEYTKKEKAQNWWHYHKFIVLGVVVAILVVASFRPGRTCRSATSASTTCPLTP